MCLRYIDELESKKKAIADVVKQKGKATSRLRRKQETIEKALSEMSLVMDGLYDTVFFDELGITKGEQSRLGRSYQMGDGRRG